jgi:eukaryotic-like serine/threonine-protein kinase
MRTSQWVRAAEVFAEVVDLPQDQRPARIDSLCADDADLRAAVQRLLEQEARSDSAADIAMDIRAGMQQILSDWSQPVGLADGALLGNYRIIRTLGEGGMGQVYLAERDIDAGVQRVALKIPQHRPGPQFIERFRRERSILAGLGHPAIARLVDSGNLDDGRPFFAMEYVDGLPITDYCDRHRLGIGERLRLFLGALAAVQHAHENLVLHRDIKAANVLVGGDGHPRLLDFGIAKSVDAIADAVATQDGTRFFSLATAAPEQVSGGATGVTTDIYALGVLLYELVCGLPALDLKDMAPAQALQTITDRVPDTPATAVLAMAERDPERARLLATQRAHATALSLSRQCRGDLELILGRALRKSPRARYASADAFARDIQALLELRPIAQRHGDRWYRLGRFLRRHRAAVISLAAVLMFSGVYLGLAWRQAEALAVARDRAEARRAQAEQVTGFLVNLFRNADPTVARGSNPDAQQLLARGAASLQTELKDQPELRATLMSTLADIYLALNDFAKARQYAEQAVTIRNSMAEPDATAHRNSLEQLARVELAGAHYADALRLIDEALQGRALGLASDSFDLQLYALRASALDGNAQNKDALALYPQIEAEMRRRYGEHDAMTRSIQRRWSSSLAAAGRIDESRELAARAADSNTIDSFSNDPVAGRQAYDHAMVLRDAGDNDAAMSMAKEALRIYTIVYGEVHSETAAARNMIATIAQQQRQYDESARHFEQALAIVERLYPLNHPRRASAGFNVGLLHLFYRRDSAAALPYLQSAVDQGAVAMPDNHPNLAVFRLGLGQALRDRGDFTAARRELGAALRVFDELAAPRGRNQASAAGELACIELASGGDSAAASAKLEQSIAVLAREMAADHPKLARLEACRVRRASLTTQ